MTTDETTNNPISLVAVKAQKENTPTDSETQDMLAQGLEAFQDRVEEASAFLSVIFDEVGDPSIIWAGDINLIKSIGSLEIAKEELIKQISYQEE